MGIRKSVFLLGVWFLSAFAQGALLAEFDFERTIPDKDSAIIHWYEFRIPVFPLPGDTRVDMSWPSISQQSIGLTFTIDETEDDFAFFAGKLTNGVDEQYLAVYAANLGRLLCHLESGWFSTYGTKYVAADYPDLYGYDITSIDMVVNDVTAEPYDPPEPMPLPMYKYTYDVTFQIYGEPVPEPATLGLLLAGGLLIKRKKAA